MRMYVYAQVCVCVCVSAYPRVSVCVWHGYVVLSMCVRACSCVNICSFKNNVSTYRGGSPAKNPDTQ